MFVLMLVDIDSRHFSASAKPETADENDFGDRR
jgi:hypothetical protein